MKTSGVLISVAAVLRDHGALLRAACVVAVVAAGLILRLASIRTMPFYEDDYATAAQAMGIMETLKPTLPSGWVQWAEPLLPAYLAAGIWHLTGGPDILVGRWLSGAAGALAILVAYLLGRRMRNGLLGLVFALLLSTNLWSIASGTYFRAFGLAELGFLLIVYVSIGWIADDRSVRGYLAVLGTSVVATLAGHYLLALVMPVSLALPLIGKLSDAVSSWSREVRRVHGVVFVASALVILTIGGWLFVRYGLLIASAVGELTGEFATRLPENPTMTLKPFYVEALSNFYGLGGLVVIAGAALMLVKTGRRGLVIVLSFAVPFVLLSTLYASATVTRMYDRYIFPFNAALLLMMSYVFVWVGETAGEALSRTAGGPWKRGLVSAPVTVLLALVLIAVSPAFLLRFDPARTPAAIEAWIRDRNEPRTPSYQRAFAYTRQHMIPTDVLLVTRSYPLPFEIPHARGFWVMSNPTELAEASIRTQQGTVDRFSGYPVVTNLWELLRILGGGHSAWLFLPYFHDSPETLSAGIWGFVHTYMRPVPEASDETLRVFRWSSGRFTATALKTPPQAYGNVLRVAPTGDGVTLLEGRPGPFNWAGLRYALPSDMDFRQVMVAVRLKVRRSSSADGVLKFDLILEEPDGDRWHLPERLKVRPAPEWQEAFIPFSYLQFWSLGPGKAEPTRVRSLKLEAVNARSLYFAAEVRIDLVSIEPGR